MACAGYETHPMLRGNGEATLYGTVGSCQEGGSAQGGLGESKIGTCLVCRDCVYRAGHPQTGVAVEPKVAAAQAVGRIGRLALVCCCDLLRCEATR